MWQGPTCQKPRVWSKRRLDIASIDSVKNFSLVIEVKARVPHPKRSCKRPLDSMESSSTPRSTFAAQMVYPEKGSVYFQSCRAGRNISPSKTTTRANSASSAEDNESDDGESRLTDLEDELNRAWEMGALSLRSPQQRTPHQRQQHVMQCFGATRKNSSEGNFINETAF
ncbi:hypothetical protein MRX96_003377 [Rhipicephalus microplus]